LRSRLSFLERFSFFSFLRFRPASGLAPRPAARPAAAGCGG